MRGERKARNNGTRGCCAYEQDYNTWRVLSLPWLSPRLETIVGSVTARQEVDRAIERIPVPILYTFSRREKGEKDPREALTVLDER